MPVKAGLSELQRLHASKARAESLLAKVRLHRVQGVLADQSTLYEVEQFLIEKGKLEVLNLGPKEKDEVKQRMIEDDPNMNVNRENDSEAEWDDDKKFGRNVSKYKDLAFNTFARGLRKANPINVHESQPCGFAYPRSAPGEHLEHRDVGRVCD